MTDNKPLHDRATRGEVLSPAEIKDLQELYVRQDQEETTALAAAGNPSLTELQAQVQIGLTQILTVTKHIQFLASENDKLRQENSALQKQLARITPAQTV